MKEKLAYAHNYTRTLSVNCDISALPTTQITWKTIWYITMHTNTPHEEPSFCLPLSRGAYVQWLTPSPTLVSRISIYCLCKFHSN